MKIAILGGGFAGLSAGYYLSEKGHDVTVLEKHSLLGGLAQGFKAEGWDWYLERAYHHIFDTDEYFVDLANQSRFGKVAFYEPVTSSLYDNPSTGKPEFYPIDTPQDLLQFPLLTMNERIRAGLSLGLLKFGPLRSSYERQTAMEYLEKTMGKNASDILFGELFRKKFGKYAEKVLASFIWARIKSRTKQLGYAFGGFQCFADHLADIIKERGGSVYTDCEVKEMKKTKQGFVINTSMNNDAEYDAVISTLPSPVLVKAGKKILPESYLNNLSKIKYLWASTLILETKKPILSKEYWVSVCSKQIPIMILLQHTNMVPKKYYGGNHILYVGNYFDEGDKLMKMDEKEVLNYFVPYIKKVSSKKDLEICKSYYFKAPYAQPIFDKEFIKLKPNFVTPVDNFYVANLDMTYPFDRGTNYAIKLGKQVSSMI